MAGVLEQVVLPGATEVIDVCDPREIDASSAMTRRFARNMRMYRYRLIDRSLLRARFRTAITRHASRDLGAIMVCRVGDRFATELEIREQGVDAYCFSRMVSGQLRVAQGGREVVSQGANGSAFLASCGTRTTMSDESGRANTWIGAPFLHRTLEGLLGERARRPLEFRMDVRWDRGLASSVASLFAFLEAEVGRPDGLVGNAVAFGSLSETLARTVLLGLPNTYSDRLAPRSGDAVPAYVRRAEEFMRDHATAPIGMEDVACAAGCSVRTLEATFRRFRDTTPLAALRGIRLDGVRAELGSASWDGLVAPVARRYGFANAHRFRLAYQRRFGTPPPGRVG